MAVEDAAEDHEPQRPAGEDEHLVEAEHAAVLGVVEELGVGGRARRAGVQVDDHAVLLARAPERLVVVVGVAGQPRGDRHGGQHDAAEDAVGARPGHLLDGAVHVVEVDRHAAGPAARRGGTEVGQPAHVAVQRGPDHLEALVGRGAEVHGGRESARQDRSGQRHLGVDPLLLEHGETAPVAVARHDPVGAVVGQPALGRVDVDAHAGQAPGRGGADRIGLVDLAGIEAAEHGDGEMSTCRRRRPPPRAAPGPRRTGSGRGCRARRGCRPTPRRSCASAPVAPSPVALAHGPGSPTPDSLVSAPHTTAGRSRTAGAGPGCR